MFVLIFPSLFAPFLCPSITLPLSVSAGQGPCICPVCGASYTYRRGLSEHMKKHTGKTTCPLCQQTFGMLYHMRRHMVNKHGMAKEDVAKITNKRALYPH